MNPFFKHFATLRSSCKWISESAVVLQIMTAESPRNPPAQG